ncbi:S8 family serine peptidase [Patescibacteria group bacterium]|nr:S8 family serine peptidase [Patescibacteria group bacterium]
MRSRNISADGKNVNLKNTNSLCYNKAMIDKTYFFNIFLVGIIIFIAYNVYSDIQNNYVYAQSGFNMVADEILVKFKAWSRPITVKIAQADNFNEFLSYYSNLPEVEYAEPNYIYQASIIPSDTYFSHQWYLQKIKAIEAWDNVRESPDIVIAILDSGVQINHPDLQSNIWLNKKEIVNNNIDDEKNGFIDDINGWDFINNVPDPAPKFKPGFTEDGILHGTIIAGIAAASGNNAAGIAGVTWKAKIMPLKVLDDKGDGSVSKVLKAVDYAIANGANIINLSFVGFGYSKSLDDAIKRAYDAGVIVVAAGGNEVGHGNGYYLDQTPMYPVCLDGANGENRVIGVAATDTIDQKANFSSFGNKCIDIAAPGVSVFSTVIYSPDNYIKDHFFNKYYNGYWSGTSVAVPMVSGAIALIESANPTLDRNEIIKALLDNTDNISRINPTYLAQLGKGRLNVAAAVNYASGILNNKIEKLLVGPKSGMASLIKIVDQDGKKDNEFYAYDSKFKGGVSFASGDINHDGQEELITAAGLGGGPHVKIFNLAGEVIGQFFAFNSNFRGGVNIAVADVDNDGSDEIIAVQASGGNSEVKIFNSHGKFLSSFYAYDNKFRAGLNIAAGDIDGDGEDEIITGLVAGQIPEIKIFKATGVLQGQFLAYPKTFRGGVKVITAKVRNNSGSSRVDIVTAPEKGGGPHVKFFDNKGNLLSHFFAFNSNFRGGVNLARADVDNDGLDEIIAAAGPGGAPHVRVFKVNGKIMGSFYAYQESFSAGVNAGSIKINKN